LKHIFNDHISDIEIDLLRKYCSESWKVQFGFFVIDKERDMKDGKYKKNVGSFFV
jgi:hypothetical protein